MSASEIRKLAREALAGKWGKAALVILVYGLITWTITFVLNFIPFVGPIALLAIEIPMAFGLISTLMKLKRGEEVSYTGFLTDGFNNFASSWKVKLWTFVKMLAPIIVFIIAMFILVVGSGVTLVGVTAANSSAKGTGGIVTVIGIIALIAASIWFAIKSYSYQIVSFILFDNPSMEAKAIVEKSEKLMQGNRWKLFCLQLSFIGWIILSGFTFGIGTLWVTPYLLIAEVAFYEALAGKSSDIQAEIVTQKPVQEDNGPISGE